MAAGDVQIDSGGSSPDSRAFAMVTGESAATAAAMTFVLGFRPRIIQYMDFEDAGTAVVPDAIVTYLDPYVDTDNPLANVGTLDQAAAGTLTWDTTNEITCVETPASDGWLVTIPAAQQTNAGYWVAICWR